MLEEIIELCQQHPRVNLHLPSLGWWTLSGLRPLVIVEKDHQTARIIELARKTNDSMPAHV